MDLYEVADQIVALLQHRRRVSYRSLKRQFALDDAYLEDLKEELFYTHPEVVDDAGRPWATLFGSNMIATVDPTTMTLRQIETPNADSRIRRIVLTSDGAVWYVDYQQGALGRYDPTTGDISEWPAPSAARSRPYGMAVDDRDRIWFVETGPSPNLFVGFDTVSETFVAQSAIPSGGGSVRHMVYHQATQSVWFGTDSNMLGRASLP